MLPLFKKISFVFLLYIVACKSPNVNIAPSVLKTPTKPQESPVAIAIKDTIPNNYWTKNNCKRPVPTPLFLNGTFEKQSFIANDTLGQAEEGLELPSGERIVITHKGCDSQWFSFEMKLEKAKFPTDKAEQTRLALNTFKQFALNAPPNAPIAFDKYYNVLNAALTQMGDIPFGIEMEVKPQPREFFTIESAQIIGNEGVISFSVVRM
jgi:hypothetical protein